MLIVRLVGILNTRLVSRIRNCDAGPPNSPIPMSREEPIVRTMAEAYLFAFIIDRTSHVFRLTWGTHSASSVFAYAAITLYGQPFQAVPLTVKVLPWPRNPKHTYVSLVWAIFSRFARRYYRLLFYCSCEH
jgi:hypothetical protein